MHTRSRYMVAIALLAMLIATVLPGSGADPVDRGRRLAAAEDATPVIVSDEPESPSATTEPSEIDAPDATETPIPPPATRTPLPSPSATIVPIPTASPANRVRAAATPAPAKLTLGANSGRVGGTLAISISGFPANKRIAIYFDATRRTTLVTDGSGAASGSIRLPPATGGLHEIRAPGSGAPVTKKFRIRPTMTIAPTTLHAGDKVAVVLTGFAASAKLKIRIYDVNGSATVLSVWAPTTDATGGLSQSFATKRGLTAGTHVMIASDPAGNSVSTSLTTYPARPKPPTGGTSRSQVFEHGPSSRPEIALTFDAGADRGNTVAILNLLARYGIKASFGITGQWAKANPDLVQRMVLEGHMVFNHTWSHGSFTGFSTGGVSAVTTSDARKKELDDTAVLIASITNGYDVRPYWRPPYGDLDDGVLRDVTADGYGVTVMWSCDTLGWDGNSVDGIVARCGTSAEAGDIILLHVGEQSLDAKALPQLIAVLLDKGFTFVTIEELLQP
jgi:peptidoglycan/xylan/chitin deacetylase (PgdA/CDA1 family)